MTKEEKELLTKVLCEQLLYGVIVNASYKDGDGWKNNDRKLLGVYQHDGQVYLDGVYTSIDNVKPYLRPLSSMTKEEKEELLTLLVGEDAIGYFQVEGNEITNTDEKIQFSPNWQYHWLNFSNENILLYVDWLNARHFDYRSLIEMGLAIAAVGEDNPYNEKGGEE